MKNERYTEYLNSGEWKHLKSLKINNANWKCEGCGESGRILEVHHLTYNRIGMELLTDLAVFCKECHNNAHGKTPATKWNKYLSNKTDEKPTAKLAKDIEFQKIIDSI